MNIDSSNRADPAADGVPLESAPAPAHAHKRPVSALRRNLRICTGEGILATPWSFLVLPSNFLWVALLIKFYGIDKENYGVIAAMPACSSFIQIILLSVVARFMTARDLALAMSWLNLGLWMMMAALLGYFPKEDADRLGSIFIIFFAFNNLSHAFLSIGWQAWIQEYIPQRIRGTYFGRRNFLTASTTLCFLVFCNLVLWILGERILAYQICLGVPLVLRVFSNLWQHSIVNPKAPYQPLVRTGWWEDLAELRQYPQLMLFVVFAAWTGFWLNAVGPFVPVFIYEELGWETKHFNLLIILATVFGAIGQPLWGRLIDRHGCLAVILLALGMWETFANLLWVIMTKEISWLMYPMWCIGGFASMGYFLALFNMVMKLIPKHLKTAGGSFNLAATSLAAAMAPVITGKVLQDIGTGGGELLPIYHAIFGIKSLAVYLGMILLLLVKEPNAGGLSELSGAMRTMRQIMQVGPLAFFANLSPMGLRKRQDRPSKTRTPPPDV